MLHQFKNLTALTFILACSCVNAHEPVWDGNKVELVSQPVSSGVFAYYAKDAKALEKIGKPVATSGGFIIGKDQVLLIDTGLNRRLYKQIENLVKKETNKNISFAINTSSHGDHSYGNMYLPESTTLIQHKNTNHYIRNHLKDDKAFMIQHFGSNRGIEPIIARNANILVPKDGKIILNLGGKQVEIIDFGFAQTGGDLFIWEPQSKTMWTGNAIVATKPALPWLLDGHFLETLATLKKVYAFLPDDAKVVPGHGTIMTRNDIQWHIDYLEAVKGEVQAAIDQGLSLDDTVKAVTLPRFSGYALFGWVHPALNIPAAYKDLSIK